MKSTSPANIDQRERAPEAEAFLKNPKSRLIGLVQLARPQQWAKNGFVLAPLLFSGMANKPLAIAASLLAFLSFCLWSSSVYCLNDLLDAAADRYHPRKKLRPVASGRVSAALALAVSLFLGVAGFLVALVPPLPKSFLWFGVLYLGNTILYCALLKHRVVMDVISIAIGFVLRILAGCWAIGVPASPWINVCGFSLALLLGFGKRRVEVGSLEAPAEFRPVLLSYTVEKLNMLLSASAAVCLLAYMLYTVSPETVALHETSNLVYTVPFVAYGVFRFLFKVQEGIHDSPVELLAKDPIFSLNTLLWVTSVVAILYWAKD